MESRPPPAPARAWAMLSLSCCCAGAATGVGLAGEDILLVWEWWCCVNDFEGERELGFLYVERMEMRMQPRFTRFLVALFYHATNTASVLVPSMEDVNSLDISKVICSLA